jgi:hypothetical protein
LISSPTEYADVAGVIEVQGKGTDPRKIQKSIKQYRQARGQNIGTAQSPLPIGL